MDESRLKAILEACYGELDAGRVPDLANLCSGDADLQDRVARAMERAHQVLTDVRCTGSADEAVAPAMPAQIGDFRLLEPIGRGGMSLVYRARQQSLDREVAFKVLRADLVATRAGRLRFEREATITAALDHPNIAPVFAAGESDGFVYLAMKLLHGRSLDRPLQPMTPARVARIGVDVASALQAAHDIGVVHRDVKPANIVLDGDIAYVVDFGLAAFVQGGSALTATDATPGTLLYLAPEVVQRRSDGLHPSVDVYGLGASLYQCLSGHPPFEGGSQVQILHRILHSDPAPLGLRGRDRDLETIILRAIDKSPTRRFATAAELGADLQRYLCGASIQSRRLGLLERARRAISRRPAVSALSAAVLAMVGAVVWLMADQRREVANRLAKAETEIASRLANGDVRGAEQEIQRVMHEPGAAARLQPLQASVRDEARLQRALAALLTPSAYANPNVLRELLAELRSSMPTAASDPRINATIAIASRITEQDSVAHEPLAESTRAAWPRTSAVLRAWVAGQPVVPAIAALPPTEGQPWDHLFAGLVLRLADSSPREVERELRLAEPSGYCAEAIRYSLAACLESQQRPQEAYDVLTPLRDSAGYGALAWCSNARLLAQLGEPENAQQHLSAANIGAQSMALQQLLYPHELEVLATLGDLDAFETRWAAVQPQMRELAHFWLLGGYAAFDRGIATGDSAWLEQAYTRFSNGLRCPASPTKQGALRLALLQLEWARGLEPDNLAPLPDTEEAAPARAARLELAETAEQVARDASRPEVAGNAGLVAAQALRAAGDLRGSWIRLERCCRETRRPEPFARYAWLAGRRIAQVLQAADDADSTQVDPEHGAAPPLDLSAAIGAERAAVVLTKGSGADPGARREAQRGRMLCAYWIGDAPTAVAAARTLLAAGDPQSALAEDQFLLELAERIVADGGFRLGSVPTAGPVPEATALQLMAALAALEADVAAGARTAAAAGAILDRWLQHPGLSNPANRQLAGFATLWRAVSRARAAFAASDLQRR